jgi:hypothetical protein
MKPPLHTPRYDFVSADSKVISEVVWDLRRNSWPIVKELRAVG